MRGAPKACSDLVMRGILGCGALALAFLLLPPHGLSFGRAVPPTPVLPTSQPPTNRWEGLRQGFGRVKAKAQTIRMGMTTEGDTVVSENKLAGAPVLMSDRDFLINGWRWHSRSAARELNRFRAVAARVAAGERTQERLEALSKGFGFVWGFHYKKLHEIESNLFFPWLREHLPRETHAVLDEMERERGAIKTLGRKLRASVDTAVSGGKRASAAATSAENLITELERRAVTLQRAQEGYIMPYVAAYIDVKKQKKFNNKVISKLGVIDSQAILVSMYDSVCDSPEEMKLFRSQIPSIAQALLPTYRRALYHPKAKWLDG
ncbi:unnamed protein product [Chrysoparadoxa australica]